MDDVKRLGSLEQGKHPVITVFREQADSLIIQPHNPAVFNRTLICGEAYTVAFRELG